MDRVKYVARWIAMVPCALAALLLAPSIVGAIFWITTLAGPVAFDLESFLDRLFFEAVSDGAGGAAFIFVGARIAPEPTARGGDVAGDCGPVSHSEAPLTRMKRVVAPREYSGSRVRGAQGTPLALRTGKYTLSEKCTPGSFGLSVAYAGA